MNSMTSTTDSTRTGTCPAWCAELHEAPLLQDEVHASPLTFVDREDDATLFVNVQADYAAGDQPWVEVCSGDDPVLTVTPAEARSLAAALLAGAELAEGVRRG